MIAIIDYGVGNLFSLKSSLSHIGEDAIVTSDKNEIRSCDRIILPGVGAFGDAIEKLESSGMAQVVKDEAKLGKPILGICLGMQLLFDKSYEYGSYDGLGLIGGSIRPIADFVPKGTKIPHMGWSGLFFGEKKNELFKYLKEGDFVYFVHSFFATECKESTIATTSYYTDITASVCSGNVYGCQFHPEKSGEAGLGILKAFCEIGEKAI